MFLLMTLRKRNSPKDICLSWILSLSRSQDPDNELVGFVVALPDMTSGIIAARGKLFPFGIFKILKEMKKSTKLMLMLGGIKEDYRAKGIDVLMAIKLLNSAAKNNKDSYRQPSDTGTEYQDES